MYYGCSGIILEQEDAVAFVRNLRLRRIRFSLEYPPLGFIHEQTLPSGTHAILCRLQTFSRHQFMRQNILPPWKLKIPILVLNLRVVLYRKHQDIYKKTTKYFNFNLPRAIQVYKIPTKHPLEHYKNNQKKQAAHWSHEDRRWQIQPGTHWEHSKISMVPTSGRGQVLKWQKSDLLMVWIEKQLCFCREYSSSHLAFYCQTHALIFQGKRTGQELFPMSGTECGETQSPAVIWETWKGLGKASRQLWQTYQVFLHLIPLFWALSAARG